MLLAWLMVAVAAIIATRICGGRCIKKSKRICLSDLGFNTLPSRSVSDTPFYWLSVIQFDIWFYSWLWFWFQNYWIYRLWRKPWKIWFLRVGGGGLTWCWLLTPIARGLLSQRRTSGAFIIIGSQVTPSWRHALTTDNLGNLTAAHWCKLNYPVSLRVWLGRVKIDSQPNPDHDHQRYTRGNSGWIRASCALKFLWTILWSVISTDCRPL